MANKLNGYTADLVKAAGDVAQKGEFLALSTQRFVDLALSKLFPIDAFIAPKENERGEYPTIQYKGGKVCHGAFWKALKNEVATILPDAKRKYAIHDTFSKYRDATFTVEAWGNMSNKEAEFEKAAFREARQRINPRIRDIKSALEKAYKGDPEPSQTTPEESMGKSLFNMSERIGKMQVTSERLLKAKKHIDAAVAALNASD